MAFSAVTSLSFLLAGVLARAASAGVGAWQASAEDVETSLIGELASLVGSGGAHRLETALAPVYAALPKNGHGRLEPEEARAALRRVFLQRPGWTLKGLGEEASAPEQLLKLVADRTSGRGVGLRELAAMSASLEGLAREESTAQLERSYQAAGLPTAGRTERAQVVGALRLYAEAYLGSGASGSAAGAWLERLEAAQWHAAGGSAARGATMSFQEAGRSVSAIERELSRFKSQECAKLQAPAEDSHCLDVSSLYSLCCRSSEEIAALSAPERSALMTALTEFPRLWLFTFICLFLTVLVNLARVLLSHLDMSDTAEAEAEEAQAEGDAAEAEGPEKAEAEDGAAEAEEASRGSGRGLLGSCLSLVLLGGAAVALDLLDVAVIAPALAVGLALVAAARFAPKQPAKAKKV